MWYKAKFKDYLNCTTKLISSLRLWTTEDIEILKPYSEPQLKYNPSYLSINTFLLSQSVSKALPQVHMSFSSFKELCQELCHILCYTLHHARYCVLYYGLTSSTCTECNTTCLKCLQSAYKVLKWGLKLQVVTQSHSAHNPLKPSPFGMNVRQLERSSLGLQSDVVFV